MRQDELRDELIDRVAEEMTQGAPSPQLRHVVRARISVPGPALGRPGLAKQARLAWIAVAAAAAIALSVVGAWTLSGPRDAAVPSTSRASTAMTPPVALAAAAPLALVAEAETPIRMSGRRRTTQRAIVIDPLVIEPISVPLIAVEASSGVMPIEIEPLQIEPLPRQ